MRLFLLLSLSLLLFIFTRIVVLFSPLFLPSTIYHDYIAVTFNTVAIFFSHLFPSPVVDSFTPTLIHFDCGTGYQMHPSIHLTLKQTSSRDSFLFLHFIVQRIEYYFSPKNTPYSRALSVSRSASVTTHSCSTGLLWVTLLLSREREGKRNLFLSLSFKPTFTSTYRLCNVETFYPLFLPLYFTFSVLLFSSWFALVSVNQWSRFPVSHLRVLNVFTVITEISVHVHRLFTSGCH